MTTYDFDKTASTYDNFYTTPLGALYDRLQKTAVESLLPDPNEFPRVLEVGCGTGHWTSFMSRQGFKVTGIDISSEMIRIVKSKKIPNADFIQADILDFPIDKPQFDIAVAFASLEFTQSPSEALLQMARTVRSGGYLLIGSLNKSGLRNMKRIREKKEPYLSAQIPDESEFRSMLSRFGDPVIKKCCYVIPSAPWLNFITEPIGHVFNLSWGEFIVGRVKR
jgi:ubiquinone/menaquinone biosynthesis C-methylase UbiE